MPTRVTPDPSPIRAFQWDLARQVERLDVLLALLPKYARWGYTELYLHLEDAVEYPSFPQIARPDAYRHRDLSKLVRAASRVGIGVVPIVNLLGHTQYLIKTPALRDLNELRDNTGAPLPIGQICPLHPRTLGVAEALINDVLPFCTAGKLHVGLDESFHLGKCPRCQAEIAERGLAYHFSSYVHRLSRLVAAHDLRLGMWADMLNFIPEAIPQLPPEIVAYDWYYYPFKKLPRVELYNFAEIDLAKPLQAQGIEYWGCPMNGAFRYEPLPLFRDRLANLRSWWRRCEQVKAGGFLITSWEAYRLAFPLTTVVDAAASSLWQYPQETGDRPLLTRGFERTSGRRSAKLSAKLCLAADQSPFAGYAAWELNEAWNVRAGLGPPQHEKKTTAKLEKLVAQARSSTVAVRASLAFRLYLEKRAVFVQDSANTIFSVRNFLDRADEKSALRQLGRLANQARGFARALQRGKTAAQAMWRLSRLPRWQSQNGALLKCDEERLADWLLWLDACRENASIAWESTPVCGKWQLVFDVVNEEPAAQRVSVDELQPDGQWLELRARHTIEFQALAAQPRTDLIRRFSVPLGNVDRPLRLVVRGVGRVRIANLLCVNGVQEITFKNSEFILGKRAPHSGLPDVYSVKGSRRLIKKPQPGAAVRGRPSSKRPRT